MLKFIGRCSSQNSVHKHYGARTRHDHKWLITAAAAPLESQQHLGRRQRDNCHLQKQLHQRARLRLLRIHSLPLGANCICAEASGTRRDMVHARPPTRPALFSLAAVLHFPLWPAPRHRDPPRHPTERLAGTPPVVSIKRGASCRPDAS